jgi:mannose-6-phosphate isomerase-like protein (cupin superfamily)
LLEVYPYQALSLQRHHRRAEQWTVLEGQPTLYIGSEVLTGTPEGVYHVDIGVVHRIMNPGPFPVRILETISGVYDESDIERLDDMYGRSTA